MQFCDDLQLDVPLEAAHEIATVLVDPCEAAETKQ
jgi:hypothetical protein